MRRVGVALLTVAVVCAATHHASADVLSNAGFEACVGSAAAAPGMAVGWARTSTTHAGCVTQATASGWDAIGFPPPVTPYGNYMAELRGEQAISQTFVVSGGLTPIHFLYSLSAFDCPTAEGAAGWFRVVLDDTEILGAAAGPAASAWSSTGWILYSGLFNLAPGAHTMQFRIDAAGASGGCGGENGAALWAHIDNLMVPEPAVLALLGFAVAVAVGRRQRQRP